MSSTNRILTCSVKSTILFSSFTNKSVDSPLSNFNWIVIVVPLFNSLSIEIWPFIKSINSFVITIPSPVPPYCLSYELSAWWNFVKIFFRKSGDIPIPVSMIWNWIILSSSINDEITLIPPFWVNFKELPIIFKRTCRIRISSPLKIEFKRLSVFTSNFMFFFKHSFSKIDWISSKTLNKLKFKCFTSISPASILEISKILLMIDRRCFDAFWAFSIIENCSSIVLFVDNSRIIPMIPFKGVRISWLIFAKNASLASEAALDAISAVSKSLSISFCFVISKWIPIEPMISFLSFLFGPPLINHHFKSPDLFRMAIS